MVDQEAIIYSEIDSASDLTIGWTDIHEPRKDRLHPAKELNVL